MKQEDHYVSTAGHIVRDEDEILLSHWQPLHIDGHHMRELHTFCTDDMQINVPLQNQWHSRILLYQNNQSLIKVRPSYP